MKPTTYNLKKLIILVCLIFLYSCSTSKYKLQSEAPINYSHAYSQDWTTDIKIGSSGTNIFLANLIPNRVQIDSIYFRKLKGKLIEGKGYYYAQLFKILSNSEGNRLTITKHFPFQISNTDCVISYIENGNTKYFKILNVKEKAGIHYPNGIPNEL